MSKTFRQKFNVIVFIMKINPELNPGLVKAKELMTLFAIALRCFEVYFFFHFRIYMKSKTSLYKKRRSQFICDLEKDFRDMAVAITS